MRTAHPGAEDPALTLSAALETALLRELVSEWERISYQHFGGRLRRPVFALMDSDRRLGEWNGRRRTLSVSRQLVLTHPWGQVLEVLKHEVAHQFVEEVMGISDETAHGPAFTNLCRKLGFDARATGLPGPSLDAASDQGPPVLRRIARLLALAESPNRHEAESAMAAAQRLMLRHNIDSLAATRAEGFAFRHLGLPRGRIDGHEYVLASILNDHFFVQTIWVRGFIVAEGRGGNLLEVVGTPSNLEVASYVHGFLLATGERLWRAHKQAEGIRGDRDRRRYLLGVMMGFAEKLRVGQAEQRREGLIYVGDPLLSSFYDQRYPRRRKTGGVVLPRSESYERGQRAGRDIVLHRPVHGAESRGRLLT